MIVYSLEQCWEMLNHYFDNSGNVAQCVRILRANFGREVAPAAPYARYFVNKVKEKCVPLNKLTRTKQPTKRTPKNIDAAAESVRQVEIAPATIQQNFTYNCIVISHWVVIVFKN